MSPSTPGGTLVNGPQGPPGNGGASGPGVAPGAGAGLPGAPGPGGGAPGAGGAQANSNNTAGAISTNLTSERDLVASITDLEKLFDTDDSESSDADLVSSRVRHASNCGMVFIC